MDTFDGERTGRYRSCSVEAAFCRFQARASRCHGTSIVAYTKITESEFFSGLANCRHAMALLRGNSTEERQGLVNYRPVNFPAMIPFKIPRSTIVNFIKYFVFLSCHARKPVRIHPSWAWRPRPIYGNMGAMMSDYYFSVVGVTLSKYDDYRAVAIMNGHRHGVLSVCVGRKVNSITSKLRYHSGYGTNRRHKSGPN